MRVVVFASASFSGYVLAGLDGGLDGSLFGVQRGFAFDVVSVMTTGGVGLAVYLTDADGAGGIKGAYMAGVELVGLDGEVGVGVVGEGGGGGEF